ncbi:ROK family protein [Lapillicoccus sp.]|uniref:ROK family transcriptional regulator n=1 Tax=Lapillicoccus sp. TaxID=1909287 RepID=UPI0032648C21
MTGTVGDRAAKRVQVLHAVRRINEASRWDLARELDISLGTVRLVVDELAGHGLVVPSGSSQAKVGRPSAHWSLNPDGPVAVGVDLAEVELRIGVYSLGGNALETLRVPFRRTGGNADPQQVVEAVRSLESFRTLTVAGVGLAVPGQLDIASGRVVLSTNLGWRDVPLRDLVAEAVDVPVSMDRNANAGMLGEAWWGPRLDHAVSVFVTVGSGVGASVRVGEHIVTGESGLAGELGHMVIDPGGPRCRCGQRGCLETFASATAIQRLYDKRRGPVDPPDVTTAIRARNPAAMECLGTAVDHLALGLAGLVNLLNPGLLVVGGLLLEAPVEILDRLRRRVREGSLTSSGRDVEITASKLGPDGVLLGAASLVFSALFAEMLAS